MIEKAYGFNTLDKPTQTILKNQEEILFLTVKLNKAMQHLTYIAETTQSNPMLFRLYDREKLTALLQFVKENQLENPKKV